MYMRGVLKMTGKGIVALAAAAIMHFALCAEGQSGMKSLRVYFSGENLLTFTRYRGMDPERIGSKSDVYPQLRSWTFGLSLDL